MTLTSAQNTEILEVINILLTSTGSKPKRQLAAMFLELIDRKDWPDYYETLLEMEWKKRPSLPAVRSSPPPSSGQKVHNVAEEEESSEESEPSSAPIPAPAPTPATIAAPTPSTATIPPRAVTPATQSTPIPVASTSTNQPVYAKPVHILPKSRLSPEMDVDILSEDGMGFNAPSSVPRDQESEEIVKQLERGLPPWPGFSEEGWSENVGQERLLEILQALKSFKDVAGNRVAAAVESVPEESTIPHLSYTTPLSFKSIENRLRSKGYQNSKEFDQEMARFFEKARRWHTSNLELYGRVLLLQ
ncbi:hypothetical protein H0H93_010350, partial [Arthromyces matolae]